MLTIYIVNDIIHLESEVKGIKVQRIEKHIINKNHPMYKTIDELCFKSKNLYNYANYIIRQEFISNNNWIRANDLDKMLQQHETYTELGSQAAQKTLQLLDKNWKSFFVSIKDWGKHKSKYLGKPKLPKYKNKDGRNIVMIKNIQFRVEDGYIYFSWNKLKSFNNLIKTNITSKLVQLRFIPRGGCYVMEIVYEKKINANLKNSKNICGIDLGINNFVTITNNIGLKPIIINGRIIKAMNQYYNKTLAKYQSILKKENNKNWSNRLDKLTLKRNNKLSYYMHLYSKNIINYCKSNNIDTIVIGYNKEWKQESGMNKKTNQNFVQIPYYDFVNKLKYKCEDNNINFIQIEESYTSGTSFLDEELPIKENYDKSRRIFRGLFRSNKGIINSDVNGSFQIIKKVFPDAFSYGIEGIDLCPIVVDLF